MSDAPLLEILKLAYGLTLTVSSGFKFHTKLFMYILSSLATSEQIASE